MLQHRGQPRAAVHDHTPYTHRPLTSPHADPAKPLPCMACTSVAQGHAPGGQWHGRAMKAHNQNTRTLAAETPSHGAACRATLRPRLHPRTLQIASARAPRASTRTHTHAGAAPGCAHTHTHKHMPKTHMHPCVQPHGRAYKHTVARTVLIYTAQGLTNRC